MKVRLSVLGLCVGAGLLAAAAFGGQQGGKGGTLRIGIGPDVDSLDPALAYTAGSWLVEWATCAKLFNYPDDTGAAGARVVPEVVERYTVSRDGKTYDFALKRTFRFQTGAPVTATAF